MSTTNESRPSRRWPAAVLAAIAASAVLGVPSTASAEEVSPDGKGIAGGALLGGELVVFGEAIFGVRSGAAYLVGAGAGAVAGGVGGYFIEQAVDDGRIPAYMLAGGLALLIPAIVVALDQTRYMPSEGAREDKPANLPPSDPGKPTGSSVVGAEPKAEPAPATPPATTPEATPPATTPPASGGGGGGTQGPRSLLNLRFDTAGSLFAVGLPVPEVRPIMGAAERKTMGVDNRGNEVRFPVVRLTF